MKLPIPNRDTARDLVEFDTWITPSLGEITETQRFKDELAGIAALFEEIGKVTQEFRDIDECRPSAVAETLAQLAHGRSASDRASLLRSAASTLFLVTGKSDNNSKCQFPLYLRDVAGLTTFPVVSERKGRVVVTAKPLPRVLKSEDLMNTIAALGNENEQRRLLGQFVAFLLGTEDAVRQFWSIGHSYFALKRYGKGYEANLLAPIVVYKVRGSVSASGGHKPEILLREELARWGLLAGIDFNANDIVVEASAGDGDEKTRAFDFVLPYQAVGWADGWHNRLMIQSQFYAGDSGSVSHKNVDQTQTSRARVLGQFPTTKFVEYVDGAGYFSSLNGDLKRLLGMSTTSSFFQVRSAAIRLRREVQAIGFVTPLEIEHAIARTDRRRLDDVVGILIIEGYSEGEARRAIESAIGKGLIAIQGDTLEIRPDVRNNARQYYLLDLIAIHGREVQLDGANSAAHVLVPGYGAFYGVEIDRLAGIAIAEGGEFRSDFAQTLTFAGDLKVLAARGAVMMR